MFSREERELLQRYIEMGTFPGEFVEVWHNIQIKLKDSLDLSSMEYGIVYEYMKKVAVPGKLIAMTHAILNKLRSKVEKLPCREETAQSVKNEGDITLENIQNT